MILFVYQLSGRFAILAERINDLKNNPDMYKSQLKAIVKEHDRLLKYQIFQFLVNSKSFQVLIFW